MLRAHSPVRSFIAPAGKPAVSPSDGPRLRLDALAWLKLQFFATTWDCVTGGFGLSGGDPLHLQRFVTVPQQVTRDSVAFEGPMHARSRARRWRRRSRPRPLSPSNVLILTHPGADPLPTHADEALFDEVLGRRDWSVLLILARDGATHAQLSLRSGPVPAIPLPVDVDWCAWGRFVEDEAHQLTRMTEAWKDEYARNIRFADESEEAVLPHANSDRHERLFGNQLASPVMPRRPALPVHRHS